MYCCAFSSGIENNPTVFYRLMPGSTAQTNKFHTFYLQQRADNGFTWADIKVNHPLDYESIKEYNLTIRVEVSEIMEFEGQLIFCLIISLELYFFNFRRFYYGIVEENNYFGNIPSRNYNVGLRYTGRGICQMYFTYLHNCVRAVLCYKG